MIRKIFGLGILFLLSGCAVSYFYDGQKYDSKEKFHQAIDSDFRGAMASVTPLPKPLTSKKLLFAMPSEAAMIEEATKRFVKLQSAAPTGQAKEIVENLPKLGYRSIRIVFDAVQKKGIYTSSQIIEMQSMNGSYAASDDTDVLLYIEPSQGSGQWFFTSAKHGKQIFSFDRSSPNTIGKVQAVLEAVQVQAIRD